MHEASPESGTLYSFHMFLQYAGLKASEGLGLAGSSSVGSLAAVNLLNNVGPFDIDSRDSEENISALEEVRTINLKYSIVGVLRRVGRDARDYDG